MGVCVCVISVMLMQLQKELDSLGSFAKFQIDSSENRSEKKQTKEWKSMECCVRQLIHLHRIE